MESEQGRILFERMRSRAFKARVGKVSNPEYSYDAKEMGQIARSIRDLSQAMHLEQDFAKRIREEERRKVEAEMKDRMQKELGTAEELKQMTHEELLRKIAELTAAESA